MCSVPLGFEFETVAAIGLQSWVHCWRRAFVFCNSASADSSEMAASRFLAAAAACVIQMSFAAESRKSYWRGCITGAMGIVHQRLLHFGADDFLFETPCKKTPQNRLFPLCRRDPVLDLQLLLPLHVVLLCFATQSLQSAVLLNLTQRFKIVLFSHWRQDPVLELQSQLPLRTLKLVCVKACSV